MPSALPSIFPLGDSALTIDIGPCIDEGYNRQALALRDRLLVHPFPGLMDIIVAYSSVSLFYDPVIVLQHNPGYREGAFAGLRQWLLSSLPSLTLPASTPPSDSGAEDRLVRIPICYGGQFGPDLEVIARDKGITPDEAVRLHSSGTYRVYMIGFLPGFSYMGKLDPRLATPRKTRPASVPAGGVGIAGIQTGIYPLQSPGGWPILGRTPLAQFNPAKQPPVRLAVGDQVQFFPISRDEFISWEDDWERLY